MNGRRHESLGVFPRGRGNRVGSGSGFGIRAANHVERGFILLTGLFGSAPRRVRGNRGVPRDPVSYLEVELALDAVGRYASALASLFPGRIPDSGLRCEGRLAATELGLCALLGPKPIAGGSCR